MVDEKTTKVSETKNKGGRPTKWKPEFNQKLIDYFTVEPYKQVVIGMTERETVRKDGMVSKTRSEQYKLVPNPTPYLEDFAWELGVSYMTLYEWAKEENKDKYPGFSEAYTRAVQLQQRHFVENGLAGITPPGAFIFVAKAISKMRDGDADTSTNIINIITAVREQAQVAPISVADRNLLSD